jgi:sn-glycerol 3-phosphate transport system substrate-binding protein
MRATLTACVAVVGLAAAAVACSDDDPISTRHSDPCPLEELDADDPVRVALQWSGPWDEETATAALERWDDADGAVELVVRPGEAWLDVANALLGDDPATVAQVSYSLVPLLASAGAIAPAGPCLVEAGVDFDSMLPAAAAAGVVDGVPYGAPAAVDTVLMLYDRAAFGRAGLDPDDPPATLAQLAGAGEALRREGFERPIFWPRASLALLGTDTGSADAADAARQWVDLGRSDLLIPGEHDDSLLPPIGSGRAAIEIVDLAAVWGYASAIAAGQQPDADLALAPVPGVRGDITPVGGGVWVISSAATPSQQAAAARMEQPQQQARLHILSDLLPASPAATSDKAIADYWRDLPLFRQAWELVEDEGAQLDGWTRVAGTFPTRNILYGEAADGFRSFEDALAVDVEVTAAAEALQQQRPAELLECLVADARRRSHVPPGEGHTLGVPLETCTGKRDG